LRALPREILLDANGNQFGGTQVAGRGASDDGTFGMGLVSFTLGYLGGAQAVDISGVHFDTSLPVALTAWRSRPKQLVL
jgi:hypothetical protein